MEEEKVIVVDHHGQEVGVEAAEKAHTAGILHRSFGVFIVNSRGQMLIHKRASTKKHCAGLWSNACSSHPKPGESTKEAAQKRLKEEMGITCELDEAFPFIYHLAGNNSPCDDGYAHLFIGVCDHDPLPNEAEFEAFKWIDLGTLLKDVHENPQSYSPWFSMVIEGVALYIKNFLAQKNTALQQSNTHDTMRIPE